jgi:uncharacterized protein YqeY
MKVLLSSVLALASVRLQPVSSFVLRPHFHAHGAALHFQSTRLFGTIVDQVTQEMKTAMKAKDQVRLNTIRLIRAEFANAQIQHRVDELSDEQAQAVLRKMSKMRVDTIQMYTQNNAPERAQAEQDELDVISSWLPSMADEETTRQWVRQAIATVGSKDNMGKVMGALMKDHKMELDGNLAQRIVKEELAAK